MRKTLRYRLYPNKQQTQRMLKTLELCRLIYNKVLEVRRSTWEEQRETLSLFDTINLLPIWKKEDTRFKQVYSQVLQNICTRVDLAFKSFFRRVKVSEKPGYPRFKSKGRYKSFTYTQNGFEIIDNTTLRLSKIGIIKIKLHHPIEGEIKQLHIKKDSLGYWYACFVVEFEPKPLSPTHITTGIDLGLTYFATLSTGEQIDNPRYFRRDEKELAKAQRKLSKAEKGSLDRQKKKRVVQHIHKRIANRRTDFAHKLSRQLVNENQIIVFEDLDIQQMQQGNWRSMNKSISDAAWRQLITYTTYKAEWAGRSVILVDPRNTSQMCSSCGQIVKKDLSVRVHDCPHCGLKIDRDHNAAINILARGMASLGGSP